MTPHIYPSPLTPERLAEIAAGRPVAVDPALASALDAVHQELQNRIASGESLYGITTGFGPLVDRAVSPGDATRLQEQLVHQLSVHTGEPLPWAYARAVMALRLQVLSRGVSGVRYDLVRRLSDLLNSGLVPAIPRRGSVGASGDLVPLSALAGVLTGRNTTVLNAAGERVPVPAGIAAPPGPKEALALVNGTSFSAAITALDYVRVRRLAEDWIIPGALVFMLHMDESFQHLAAPIYRYKNHESVTGLQQSVQHWLGDFDPAATPGTPQPPYSSRTFMLWVGSALERLDHARRMLDVELNAVDDNPLFIDGSVYHAGNFQGTFVAHAADEITGATVLLMQIMERQLNRMLHTGLNGGRPPFLAPGPAGLYSGLQGLQLLMTSLLADVKKHGVMHTALSYPTNADNQDIVSMSATAANALTDAAEVLETGTAAWLAGLCRLLQVDGDRALPPALAGWKADLGPVLAADHRSVDYSAHLEEIRSLLRRTSRLP